MGEVYKARDTRLDRLVAIKLVHAKFSDRFAQEARASAQLNHPNICTLCDVGPDYLVMEFIEGCTLKDRIAAGPIPRHEALEIACQSARGLVAAHQRAFSTAMSNPAILCSPLRAKRKSPTSNWAKLIESAPPGDSTATLGLTEPGMAVGTPLYMSPEQFRGERIDQRSLASLPELSRTILPTAISRSQNC